METQVRTPQQVFMLPQRLVVPLFQRPYVWNEDNQWAPLWRDVTRVAERNLAAHGGGQQPHFLGAVVLQQLQNPLGSLQTRTVIDGQQRLTTLQIMLILNFLIPHGIRQTGLQLTYRGVSRRPRVTKQVTQWPTGHNDQNH